MENFVITKWKSVLHVLDQKGKRKEYLNRHSAGFVITLRGKLCFSCDENILISEAGHPVFLPKGLCYWNECLESAESYVFNFQTLQSYETPMALSPVSDRDIQAYYERIRSRSFSSSLRNHCLILEDLYSLSAQLFRGCASTEHLHPMVIKAMDFMWQYCDRTELTVGNVAKHCCISEVYLRKLFERELKTTPFRQLTEIRMKRARQLVDEKRPLKEIADQVGYADVFQLSRAYKRYFGHSPSKS